MSLQCFSECFFQEGLLFLKGKKSSFDLRKGVSHKGVKEGSKGTKKKNSIFFTACALVQWIQCTSARAVHVHLCTASLHDHVDLVDMKLFRTLLSIVKVPYLFLKKRHEKKETEQKRKKFNMRCRTDTISTLMRTFEFGLQRRLLPSCVRTTRNCLT